MSNDDDSSMAMKHLLNCRNCAWSMVVEGEFIHADYERDAHEESIRNALSTGPYCPKGAVVLTGLPENAEVR